MEHNHRSALSLTKAHIEAHHNGPPPPQGNPLPRLSEAAIEADLDAAMAANRGDFWLFGYGSLMWPPGFPAAERRLALVHGYHRRFCLWQWRHRGSDAAPNLMLSLDSGGACTGVAYRIAGPGLRGKLRDVWHRELGGDGYRARWMTALTDQGPLRLTGFAINRTGARYAGRLPDDQIADIIAAARGHSGTGAEYLLNTAASLEGLGLRDAMLWRMQRLVAERLPLTRA
jgi:cation transport protein ChaC